MFLMWALIPPILAARAVVEGSSFRRGSPTGPVVLTLELDWTTPEASPTEIELSEGRILGAVVLQGGLNDARTVTGDLKGVWQLGAGASGRARVRLQAPLGASLLVRSAGRTARVPIGSSAEGPWRTVAKDPLSLRVKRLPWDAIELRAVEPRTTYAPGREIDLTLGFNILTPEPTEVSIRYVLELRPIGSSKVVWRLPERKEVAPTNNPSTPTRRVRVKLPEAEGVYLLEARASWDSTERGESSRPARRLLHWRNSAERSAARKTVLVVSRRESPAWEGEREQRVEPSWEPFVDAIDLSKPLSGRSFETGRSPIAAGGWAWSVPTSAWEIEPRRRERLRNLLARATGVEPAKLPAADADGLAWSAFGLEVKHPGRPHRLTLKVVGGRPAALAIGLIESDRSAPGRPRPALDVCASAPPIIDERRPAVFSYLVWPTVAEPTLVVANRSPDSSARLGSIELTELETLEPAGIRPPAGGSPRRRFGLVLSRSSALDRFAGVGDAGRDPLAAARRLADYLEHCGADLVVLPEESADSADRASLDGQAVEDSLGPPRLTMVARVLRRRGISVWVEARCDGRLPGLPAADSVEAARRGLVLVDRFGRASERSYQPLHPEVREALAARLVETLNVGGEPIDGVLLRLDGCATLPGGLGFGLDDATFARFVGETFDRDSARGVPGRDVADPERFAARERFVAAAGRLPWRTWRCKQVGLLHDRLSQALRRARPTATFAIAAPSLAEGPLGDEAKVADLAGSSPESVWKAFGLDLEFWPLAGRADAPVLFRTVGANPEGLEHDLALSPELDRQVVRAARRGALLSRADDAEEALNAGSVRLTAPAKDDDAGLDEWFGHALAALDPSWFLADADLVSGREGGAARLAKVVRSLPRPVAAAPVAARDPSGIAVRAADEAGSKYLSLANDTPYPVRLGLKIAAGEGVKTDASAEGSALESISIGPGRRLIGVDLGPFGISAIRFDAPGVRVEAIEVDHPAEVKNGLKAQFAVLTARLSRLARLPSGAPAGPINPSFEPETVRAVKLGASGSPRGWTLVGPARLEIDTRRPHSGQGSLRLSVRGPAAVLSSEPFAAPASTSLTFRAWLRSEPAGLPVRVSLEGNSNGKTIARAAHWIAGGDWSPRDFQAGDLPPGGLDRVRIRFETPVPGRLWIDDVGLSGALTEAERLNASRALAAALQAYRERHYADFARLASSHWAGRLDAEPVSSVSAKTPKEEKKKRF